MKQNFSPLPSGVWPPALTAFTPSGELDLPGNRALFEWYASAGVDGLFALELAGGSHAGNDCRGCAAPR